MHLVKVRVVQITDPKVLALCPGGGAFPVTRAELPASFDALDRWQPVSNIFDKDGSALVWLPDASDDEIAQILKQEGASVVQRLGSADEGKDALASAKLETDPLRQIAQMKAPYLSAVASIEAASVGK